MPRVRLGAEELRRIEQQQAALSRMASLANKIQRDGGADFTPGACAALAALCVHWKLEPAPALHKALLVLATAAGALPGREVR